MYCSRCEHYIPTGLNLSLCPNCNVDLNEAAPRERLKVPEVAPIVTLEPEVKSKKRQKNIKDASAEEKAEPVSASSGFNFIHPLWQSFYSSQLYFDAAKKWTGACLIYFTVLVFSFSFFLGIWMYYEYDKWKSDHFYPILGRTPAFSISGGQLKMIEKSPYTVTDSSGNAMFILDASGRVPAGTTTIVGRNAAFYSNQGKTQTYPYPPALKVFFDSEILFYLDTQLQRWLSFFSYPFVVVITWPILLIMTFFFSLAAIIINLFVRSKIDFGGLFRITVLAMTPGCLIQGIVMAFVMAEADWQDWLSIAATLGYIAFGLISSKRIQGKINEEVVEKNKSTQPLKLSEFFRGVN